MLTIAVQFLYFHTYTCYFENRSVVYCAYLDDAHITVKKLTVELWTRLGLNSCYFGYVAWGEQSPTL